MDKAYIISKLKILFNNNDFQFLLFILLSFIAAAILDKIIIASLKRFINKTQTDLDDKLISVLDTPLYNSILFTGFIFSLDMYERFLQLHATLSSIFITVIVFSWARGFFKTFGIIIKWYGKKPADKRFIKRKALPLFENLGRIIIVLLSIYFLMLCWNIDLTAWLASAGIMSVAIGFAAKDTLGNLFAGVFIMADSPYKEGDYIILDTGERGYVTSIGIRSTRIQTRDDIEITIPNSLIATSKIVNESGGHHEKERVRINVEIAYGSIIEDASNIMYNIAVSSNSVCNDPEPRVRFRQFGESGLRLQLLAWIEKPELKGFVIDELSKEIYNTFNKEGITFPFPQRTIHIKKTDI